MYEVKDSGERSLYVSGFVRDTEKGKVDYSLIPVELLKRLGKHMTLGAEKYGIDNWRKATSDESDRFKRSAWRHFIAWQEGEEEEDHMSATVFNLIAYEIAKNNLPTNTSHEQ